MAAFRNNSTSPECENTSFLITDLSSNGGVIGIGILQLVVALFCISLVVCLLLRLKGRVWDSSAKRFTLAVMVCFTLSFLNNAALFFSIQYSPTRFYVAYFFINACLLLAYDLYLTAALVALLLQAGDPILPENLKKRFTPRMRCLTETVFQLLIPVLSLLNTVPLFENSNDYYSFFKTGCGSIPTYNYFILCLTLGCSILILVLTSAILGYLSIKFLKTSTVITRKIRVFVLKLFFLVFSTLSLLVCDFVNFTLYEVLSLSTPFTVVFSAVNIAFLISLVILNYPLHTWFFKDSPSSTLPPLPTGTEREKTNPVSVWDHRNVPSTTVANWPHEMSDCDTDFQDPYHNYNTIN